MELNRPVVFDFSNPADFFRALGEYNRKARRGFSVRARSKELSGCSPALVSQVLNGERRLKRDQLPNFARVFMLNSTEVDYIDDLLKTTHSSNLPELRGVASPRASRVAKNHLLSDWLHPYVKDLVELRDFQLSSRWMLQKLGGVAPLKKIEKSVQFLFREGFWRKTENGKVVPEEQAVVTTNDIPNEKIRAFHRRALKIAQDGLEQFPVSRRKASTVLVAVNDETQDELKALLNKFHKELIEFIELHPPRKTELVQVAIHMTPVGGHDV